MPFCGKCGSQLVSGQKFCPSCGAASDEKAPVSRQRPTSSRQGEYASMLQEMNNTADSTASFDADDITQNKVMAVLAYLGPLVLIPLFAASRSPFARFHSNQGLILFIAEIAYCIVYAILSSVLLAISWRLYFIVTIIGLISLVFLVPVITGVINASNGRAKELPLIGGIRILK